MGGSVGISILEVRLAENTQIVHARLVEQLRPDNPLAQAPHLAAPFSLTTPSGLAALNAEVTRQAAMVAYLNDFALMMVLATGSIMLLLLVRPPPLRPAAKPAIRMGGGLRPALTIRSALLHASRCALSDAPPGQNQVRARGVPE